MTHENYWRQLLRWLVDGVPGPVEVHTSTDRVEAGEQVTVTADVVDDTFVEINDAQVVGQSHRRRAARYRRADAVDRRAQRPVSRHVRLERDRACMPRGRGLRGKERRSAQGQTHVRAAPGDAEYFDATMHAARLQRIADETGGRFYTPETMGDAAEDLKYTGRGVTTVEERDLWHMPIVLLLLRRADLRRVGLSTSGGAGVRLSCRLVVRCRLAARRCCAGDRRAGATRRRRTWRSIVGLAGEPEHAELFQRWAARSSTRRRSSASKTSSTWRRSRKSTRSAITGQVDQGRDRQGVRQAGGRRRRRRRVHRADRPRHVRRQGGEVQPAGTGPDAGGFRAAAEEAASRGTSCS